MSDPSLISLELIRNWLDQEEKSYTTGEAGYLETQVQHDAVMFNTQIVPLDSGVVFFVLLSNKLPDNRLTALSETIHRINDRTPFGSFEISHRYGVVGFKTFLFSNSNGKLSSNAIGKAFSVIESNLELFWSLLSGVLEGFVSLEQVLERFEKDDKAIFASEEGDLASA